MAAKLAKLPLAFHPGEEWAYGIWRRRAKPTSWNAFPEKR